MLLGLLNFSATQIFLMFLQVGLDSAEFVQELIVLQDLQILHMKVCFGVTLEAFVRLPRIDSFEDAKFAEILQIDL